MEGDIKQVDDAACGKTATTQNPGFAPVKQEFIDRNHTRKLVTDYMPEKVAGELQAVLAAGKRSAEEDGITSKRKRAKLRGKTKHRPIFQQPMGEKICPQLVREVPCPWGEKCRFSHNKASYLANKPPDLEGNCYIFDTYGSCPYSFTCRFSGNHTAADGENVVDEELQKSWTGKVTEKNILSMDLQHKLRKKQYDFTRADETWNAVAQGLQPPMQKPKDSSTSAVNLPPAYGSQLLTETYKNDTAEAIFERMAVKTSLNALDADMIRIRPEEKKKLNLENKLYLAPLTTVGNLPFRRVCKTLGADITCGEMAFSTNLLQGQSSEWALLKRHASEDLFGVQICGSYPDTMTRCAQLLTETCDVDFIDINCGCPIDVVFKKGQGCALMGRAAKMEQVVRSMTSVMDVPLTLKMRTGIYENQSTAHELVPKLRDWGLSALTIHGRSREQRYTKLADWEYLRKCASLASPMPFFGNGDVLSYEDYNRYKDIPGLTGIMIGRGALIKPWLFTEIKNNQHWDISATERFDILKQFVNYGLEHWGSDDKGICNTRKFLLEWLSFMHRYIPVGLLEHLPQKINEKPPHYFGRSDLETLLSSPSYTDWIKISEMLLGPVPDGFTFVPKHKANAYQ